MKNLKTKLAALMVKSELRDFKKLMDAGEVGGTALLGISKPVIKAHGSSDARAIKNALLFQRHRQLYQIHRISAQIVYKGGLRVYGIRFQAKLIHNDLTKLFKHDDSQLLLGSVTT